MINFDFSKHCTGCSVCHDVCPVGCISMQLDRHDFIIPRIDRDKCLNCGKCDKVCPYLNFKSVDVKRHVYMVFNKNVRERTIGSSGSVMIPLAKYILRSGGVVYGAEFDRNLQLHHSRATNYDAVLRQSKSKYIQSDTIGIYKSVKKDLSSNMKVLFVGTPCQTHALNNFISDAERRNLTLVDFLCHGVPSQVLFDKAIKKFEKEKRCKVTNFSFREKSKNRLRNYKISYTKDKIELSEEGIENDFPFYCGYLKYYPFRESCYECKFATEKRVSDITIGDMWGIEWTGELDDFYKGYSLVYTNNELGEYFFNMVKDELTLREFELTDPRTENFTYKKHTIKTKEHILFRLLYPYLSYDLMEQLFFADKKRRNRIQRTYFKLRDIDWILKQKIKGGIYKVKRYIWN